MWRLKVYGRFFSLMMCLVACTSPVLTSQPPSTSFDNLLNSPECLLPCWMGIEVDETSFHRAREILINKYGVENVTGSDEKNLEWQAHGVDGVDGGHIAFYENVAVDMFLFFGKNVGPSVEELIGVLGKPLWVFIGAQPNVYCLKHTLIYPD